jgi:hypothetical protein
MASKSIGFLSYVGYTGGLRLVEDIYSAIMADFQ